MASYKNPDVENAPPIDLSKWSKVPLFLMAIGGLGVLIGLILGLVQGGQALKQFGFSWLTAFMFFLSICLGGLFLTLVHHLFDASWSVPIRRVNEHLANFAPWMIALFIPIALLASTIYPWMTIDPHSDHALHAKYPLLTKPGFYISSIFALLVWWFFANRLRRCSLEQDKDGSAVWTKKMRFLSGLGVVFFAPTLTIGAILWIKALQHHWFSTMFGVWYFAGSVWTTIATVYLITMILKRNGQLRHVVGETQFYFLGSLFFAFTVFYAYITFSQYFIIWNANIPEETFWYVQREKGSWWDVGQLLIFGHFFLPFLMMLRIDVKMKFWYMVPLVIWAWLMHFLDMHFNIMPVLHPDGFVPHWITLSCMAFMGGLLATVFLKSFHSHPYFPQRDPRIAETLGQYVPPLSAAPAKPTPSTGHA